VKEHPRPTNPIKKEKKRKEKKRKEKKRILDPKNISTNTIYIYI
jgi:hypothetical protein